VARLRSAAAANSSACGRGNTVALTKILGLVLVYNYCAQQSSDAESKEQGSKVTAGLAESNGSLPSGL